MSDDVKNDDENSSVVEKKIRAPRKARTNKVSDTDSVVQAAVDATNAGRLELEAVSPDEPLVVIHQHFLNDLSVENPAGILDARAAQATLGQRIQVDVSLRDGDPATFKPGEPTHQVTLCVEIKAELDGRTIYQAEMRYRTLVEARNMTPEQLGPALFVMVPESMFPAVKEVMERTGGYAGYPALTIQPIDFALIYAQSAQKKEEGVSLH